MSDFLLELGLEEIPARMIAGAEAELGKRVRELLTRERLLTETAKFTTYSTPAGRAGRGRAGKTSRYRREAHWPVMENCVCQ